MKPDFEKAKHYVSGRLARELSPHLTYHSLRHTFEDVLPAAQRLGEASALEDGQMLLLTTAALFHDTGFLLAYQAHEDQSILLARAALPDFGYTDEQIEAIASLIGATRMPQRPCGLLQELLCDADLDLLGREDFIPLNRALLAELRHFAARPIAEDAWLREQTLFLEEHHFFSPAALALRAAGKARNLALMRAAVASFNGASAGRYAASDL